MKKLLLGILLFLNATLFFAQNTATVKGKVVDAKTQAPLVNATIKIENTELKALTGFDGSFNLKNVPAGEKELTVSFVGYSNKMYPIEVTVGKTLDIGIILLDDEANAEQQLSLVTLTEGDLTDDDSSSESTAGILQASRDAFQQAAAFNWGQARFRIRGLDGEYNTTMINGITMNKIQDGRPQFGNWGGLNDVTRLQEFTLGSIPSDYTFGGALGTQNINTRATGFRKGSRISFSGTNTNYTFRTMATTNSGLMENGWAYSFSMGRRWAKEGYFEGTDYSANSMFAAVEKRINDKHSINLTSIYAQSSRGGTSPNTEEVNNLKGFRYNSYWGYQNGKKRNSRDRNIEEPMAILSHYWKMGSTTTLNTNVSYQLGTAGRTRLEYPNAENPDPTYYKNLPSYYLNLFNPTTLVPTPNPTLAALAATQLQNNGQLDWLSLYTQNAGSPEAKVVLTSQNNDDKIFSVNTILSTNLSDHILLNAGVNYRSLISHNYAEITDLLGAEYLLNKSTFINDPNNPDELQYDLNNPDQKVGLYGIFGYNYNIFATVADAFAQFKFTFKKADFYVGGNFAKSEYQREGLFRNGNYLNNSFGKSEKVKFDNFGVKAGVTYKLTSQHLFDFNGLYMNKAPNIRNTFSNARFNNNITADLKSETITSADASYLIRLPKLKTRVTAYGSTIQNSTNIAFYFAEGVDADATDDEDQFISEILSGVNKKNYGLELGIDYQLTSTIRVTAAGSYGKNLIDNNPNLSVNFDNKADEANTNPVEDYGKAYLKNYRQAGAPQTAASLGIEYRDPNFWNIGINANYLDDSYIGVSNIIRTNNFTIDPATGGLYPGVTEEKVRKYLTQEKFDAVRLVNIIGGKSWRIGTKTLGFFASVNNLFDLKYKSGGFEQSRKASFTNYEQDNNGGTPSFGSRYFYNFGRTYFVNLYLNF
jgi:hypothetical protein